MKSFLLILAICLNAALSAQPPAWVCVPADLTVFPMESLNTPSIEFSPVYYQSGLVYVMAREKMRFLDPTTGRAYFDLMYTDLGADGRGTKPVNFSSNIRTQYHEGSCAFSADGREIYFTRSNVSGGKGVSDGKGSVQLQIFRGVRGPDDWEQIAPLSFCSDTYSVAHPAISADGRLLVFSSNMPGGVGGMDLYLTTREGDDWSEPVNLGPGINTRGHDVFPVWHPAGFLFFSSDGREGLGGLDLYVARATFEGMVDRVQHLPEPFNGKRDDLGLILNREGTSGYFASSRKPSKGKDDLYGWTSASSIFCDLEALPSPWPARELLVTDEAEAPLEEAHAWLIPLTRERKAFFDQHFDTRMVPDAQDPGKFLFEWRMTDSLSYATADAVTGTDGVVRLAPDPGLSYALAVQRSGYVPVVEMISGDQLPDVIRLQALRTDTPDCLPTWFSVFAEGGQPPLNGARVSLAGTCLGEPIVRYTDEAGRVQVCLPVGCTIEATVEQNGYATHTFPLQPEEADEEWKVYLTPGTGLSAPPAPIPSGTVIILDNIYYDFNKSEIRKGDAAELISLANMLKQYPDIRIELTAHTDTRGTEEYNLELSRRRAEAARQYLVLQGVKSDRIDISAAGESQPRNHCLEGVTCTDAEHQYNRRTEVRIINPARGMQIRYKANEGGHSN